MTAGIGTLGITSEHRDFAESVRGWLARAVPPAVVRAALDAEQEERPAFWGELAGQGLLANHLPEAFGGAGAELLTLAVALEETGRAAVPGPFLPTATASVFLAAAAKTNPAVAKTIAALGDGSQTAAVALGAGALVAESVEGGYLLTGSVEPVIGAALADWLLLTARRSDGSEIQALVASGSLDISALASLDRTRRVARVNATGVIVPRDHVIVGATSALDHIAALLASAEAVGIADWCTRTAAEYAKVRVQFGKPIGQFQGVKHRCARMVARLEQARSAVWDAAFVAGSGSGLGSGSGSGLGF
ncbi:MAG: acyl-CoA/acyl-ACP dehydrogenase, partial [Catenulispora sp.]|nr:acyl-CoA/acyl-ACP dehydrogenase [Catenulispora sp.]